MAKFSVTDRQTFRRCRRQWDYSSKARKNLTGVGAGAEELELGSLIHRALADWIDVYVDNEKEAIQENYLKALFLEHASRRQQEIKDSFEQKHGFKIPAELLAPLANVVNLGLAMCANYQEYHKTPIPKHMHFASAEQEVEIPVPGTEHRCTKCILETNYECDECKGTGIAYHYLTATLDGLLQDENYKFYVLEHKTYENRPDIDDLKMNDQFSGYAWVVYKLGIGEVAGIAYDGMWKRAEPPKNVKDRKTGKYRPAVMSDLFIRTVLPKSEMWILEWEKQLAPEILEMANNPEIYPNVPWQGCGDCHFREVCVMQMHGEDPTNLIKLKYTQREIVRGGKNSR